MKQVVTANSGRMVSSPGDFLLALFNTSRDALDAAVSFLQCDEPHGSRVKLKFRVGLHVGDVFEQGGDYLGVAINVASRLQQAAPIGGLVASQTFRDSLPGNSKFPMTPVGLLNLKNIDEPINAYEMRLVDDHDPEVADTATADEDEPPASDILAEGGDGKPTIVVRPFRVMGDAPRAAIFADGLFEELLTTLGIFSDVFRSVEAVGEHLKTDVFQISGHVRNGDRLRITCRLTNRESGDTLWSDRFDFSNDAHFDAQERITIAVVTALHIKLTQGESAQLWSNRSTSILAWEQFHLGRMSEAKYTSASNRSAQGYFRRAIELDQEFVPAIIALGFSHLDAVRLGWSEDEARSVADADACAKGAARIDPIDPYGIALVAYVERARGQFAKSLETMRRSVRAAHRNGELVGYYGNMLWMQGDSQNAIEQYERALSLIPQPPTWIYANLGLALISRGKNKDALAVFERIVAAEPDYVRAHAGLVVAHMRLGRKRRARDCYRVLITIDPGFRPDRWIDQDQFENKEEIGRFITDLRSAMRDGR